MTAVMFERRGWAYSVRFAYSRALVDIIKTTVPADSRSWDPATKRWSVDVIWAPILASAIRGFGHTVIGLDPPTRRDDIDPAGWARAVLHRVGPNRAPQAYKLLSRVCHPDHGGDHQLQLELNQAYAELPPNERRSA